MGEDPKKEDHKEENDFPEKYLLQYIIKKTKKEEPTWQDINELNHAKNKLIAEIFESEGESEDYFLKTLERIKLNREKVGVMVSFIHPKYPDMMAIGYSLCNLRARDKFNYQAINPPFTYVKAKGFGQYIAFGRAEEWSEPESKLGREYKIPPSIRKQFHDFILRSQRYYKDKKLPQWIVYFMANY